MSPSGNHDDSDKPRDHPETAENASDEAADMDSLESLLNQLTTASAFESASLADAVRKKVRNRSAAD